jgi:hypothetical protein
LTFKLDYVHPYIDGVLNPKNRTFRASCFNSRKLSPVFTGGPGSDEVPPIWIDRVGCKANITEVHVVSCNLYMDCVSELINNMPFLFYAYRVSLNRAS